MDNSAVILGKDPVELSSFIFVTRHVFFFTAIVCGYPGVTPHVSCYIASRL